MTKENSENKTGKTYTILGFMSGTSMDGVDVALIKTDGVQVVERIASEHLSYDEGFKGRLQSCLNKPTIARDYRDAVEMELTNYHIRAAEALIKNNNIDRTMIDYAGLHGHTIDHRPQDGITVQIGDGDYLSEALGLPVIYDFRTADVLAGGQGAPLVPIYHHALVQNTEFKGKNVALVNIGGVANITYIPADCDTPQDMIAFDTGPGNALIDDWCVMKANRSYDENGFFAAKGKIDHDWLAKMMDHPYFSKPYPKSLDRNQFAGCLSPVDYDLEDGAASLTAFTVETIASAIEGLPTTIDTVFICGGGRHNEEIIKRLKKRLYYKIMDADKLGLDSDMIEAEAFAYFAARHVKRLPISFRGTTGVRSSVVCGRMSDKGLEKSAQTA